METNDFSQFNSLMELASTDTSDLTPLMSRLPKQGIYISLLGKAGITEQAPQDPADPMSYNLALPGTILFFKPLDENDTTSAAELEGKNLNERYFLWGKQVKEAIQLLMGRFKSVGLRYKGNIGGVEGSAPGWIDEAEGKRVAIRVRHYTRDGQDRAAFDWLTPKQLDKLKIGWEVMQRDFIGENGHPVDPLTGEAVESVAVAMEAQAG